MRRAPDFWWRRRPGTAARLLWPAAAVWGWAAARRMERAPRMRAAVPVVCVGNFVVGGAGKTPTALALARLACDIGLVPGFLTRGYGGAASGPLMVDPARHDAGAVGDEALLLAAEAPTAMSADRPAGAKLLVAAGVDLIIMDDGFQNPSLAKDLNLLVVDAAVGIGNGRMVPAGPVRAPMEAQFRRAQALVLVGEGDGADELVRAAARSGKPTLRAGLKPVRVRQWRGTPILAFAGIGRPEKFFASLAATGAKITDSVGFPDHHPYSPADADYLVRRAETEGLRLVTTEKDHARLRHAGGRVGALAAKAEPFAVTLEFDAPLLARRMLQEALARFAARRQG